MYFYIKIFLLLGLLTKKFNFQEIKTTGYVCANQLAELNCPKEHVIIVIREEHKYTTSECIDESSVDYNSEGLDSFSNCIGVNTRTIDLDNKCNGQVNCYVNITKKKHSIGHYGTNCDFVSNIGNIFYSCVPKYVQAPYKSFDICDSKGPETILGVENGFINSPNYPEYYGNNRDCYINVAVPSDKRLVIYLLSMGIENKNMLGISNYKDYLSIDNGPKWNGKSVLPFVAFNNSYKDSVQIRFQSDYMTFQSLTDGKGFLLYFSLYSFGYQPITPSKPTTTTTTSTSTTTTTETTKFESILVNKVSEKEKKLEKDSDENLVNNIPFSQRIENDLKPSNSDNMTTIVTVLVSLIGLLLVIISGLLFLFRKKQKTSKINEEEVIYDEKSIRSGGSHYSDEYAIGSVVNSNEKDNIESKRVNELKQTKAANNNTTGNQFYFRLRQLYENTSKNLGISNQLLTKQSKNQEKMEERINSNRNSEKLLNQEDKIFNVNEFNPADENNKFEKEIPIKPLRQFSSPFKNELENKVSNFDQEAHQQKNKCENIYVTSPVIVKDQLDQVVKLTSNDKKKINNDQVDSENASIAAAQKLKIYEVNVNENYAYITPSNKDTCTDTASLVNSKVNSNLIPNKKNEEVNKSSTLNKNKSLKIKVASSEHDNQDDAEIYQSINDIDINSETKNELNDTDKEKSSNKNEITTKKINEDENSLIYSTPTNLQLSNKKDANSSEYGLLQETLEETNAYLDQ